MRTLVPIKMLVFSLTELHTPHQTLSFSTVGKEQPLFKSVTRLNPVFQPILTVTIVKKDGQNLTKFHKLKMRGLILIVKLIRK